MKHFARAGCLACIFLVVGFAGGYEVDTLTFEQALAGVIASSLGAWTCYRLAVLAEEKEKSRTHSRYGKKRMNTSKNYYNNSISEKEQDVNE